MRPMAASEPNTPLRDQRISAVIACASNAEELLEECGIDYWFDCDRTLGAACAGARVDVAALENRLLASPKPGGPQPEDGCLSDVIGAVTCDLDAAVRPAIVGVRTVAARVSGAGVADYLKIIDDIESMISAHERLVRAHVMPAIAAPPSVALDQHVVRELARQHALLALRVKKAADVCKRLAADGSAESATLDCATRRLAQAIHHHVRISYQNVMPQLFALVSKRPPGCETW